jgi:hypothetical protein
MIPADREHGGEWRWISGGEQVPRPTVFLDENPEVGRLLGPDGNLARIVRARPERPLGFRPDGAV